MAGKSHSTALTNLKASRHLPCSLSYFIYRASRLTRKLTELKCFSKKTPRRCHWVCYRGVLYFSGLALFFDVHVFYACNLKRESKLYKQVLPSGFSDAANATYNVKKTYNMVLSTQSSHQAETTCGWFTKRLDLTERHSSHLCRCETCLFDVYDYSWNVVQIALAWEK